MKSIILLVAILAFASARINPSEFYTGFTEELEFTQQNHAELKACAVEIGTLARKYLAPGKAALQAQLLSFVFADDTKHRETLLAVAEFLQTALPECKQFAQNVFTHYANEASITEDEQYYPRSQLLNYRLKKHASYFLSGLVRLYDEIKESRSEDAGVSVAHLIEVLTGLEHPETLIQYAQEYKQPIEVQVMETERFVQQVINHALDELTHGDFKKVSLEQVKELVDAVQSFFVAHLGAQYQLAHSYSVVEKEVVILGAVRDLTKISAVIAENVKIILAPHFQNFHLTSRREALSLAANYIHNYYLNLPYIERKVVDIVFGVRAHQPLVVGHAIARTIQLISGDYHNHGMN